MAESTDDNGLVLIVDDVADNIRVLGNMLKNRGYNVIPATSGSQAISIAKARKPDLILLDIQMPEMDGYHTCEAIKADPEMHEIPVIFLTARHDPEDIVKGFEFGGVDYITKPFNSTELFARVSVHIELKKIRDRQAVLITELRDAMAEVKKLSGMLPICAGCKKIRDDKGYWLQVEEYISEHSEAEFTHSMCPDCLAKYYPALAMEIEKEEENKKK